MNPVSVNAGINLCSIAANQGTLAVTGGQSLPSLSVDTDQLRVVGGYTQMLTPHQLRPLPSIPLTTTEPGTIIDLMAYAGIHYASAGSPAAAYGVNAFNKGREFALSGRFDLVTFDWDHTVSNYKIFETLGSLIWLKIRKDKATRKTLAAPLTSMEAPLLYMPELIMGMMMGFAIKQGLNNFNQWQQYRPQVVIASHTWPDRIGVLGSWSLRFLPLMEGLIPGDPETYQKLTSKNSRAFLNLHDFLDHATALMNSLGSLQENEAAEALAYLEMGKAHKTKPWGAFERKWGVGDRPLRILHFDDSPRVVADLRRRPRVGSIAVLVQSPWTRLGKEVGEGKKLQLSGLWQSRGDAIISAVNALADAACAGSAIPNILGALDLIASGQATEDIDIAYATVPLEGAVLTVHEAGTDLERFRRFYDVPTSQAKTLIRRRARAASSRG